MRLLKLGVDVKHYLMKEYPHGFCNFDVNMGISECRNGTIKTEEIMREFFKITEIPG